jgi:Double-GTPase 2
VTVAELPPAGGGSARLFVHHPSGTAPIVVDPPRQPRPAAPAPPPLAPGEVRCTRCLQAQPELPQVFRCAGRCAPLPDPVRSAFLGEPVSTRPLFRLTGPPMHIAGCPDCGVPSSDLVCTHCHALLPPNSTVTDPVSLTVVGARGTGKTTYLLALVAWLQQVWGPATGATAVPLDGATATRLAAMRAHLAAGRTVAATPTAAADPQVLDPLLFRLDQRHGRVRALAVHDVAGEDLEDPRAVRAHAPTLERTDALLFLLDPLQIRSVRHLLDGQVPLPPLAGDPLAVLENVVVEVRRRTGGSGRLPVPALVALSKLDGVQRGVRSPGTELSGLLDGGSALMHDPTPPAGLELDPADRAQTHEETRSLLLRLGATQFVRAVESTFARTEYFALSALGHAPAGGTVLSEAGISPFRVADPLRWLVDAHWPSR